MKKIYILSIALIAGAMTVSAAPRHESVAGRVIRHASAKADKARSDELWCPAQQQLYTWDDGDWVLAETNRLNYNSKGLITEDITVESDNPGASRTIYTYNDNGNWTSRIMQYSSDMADYRNSMKTEREFDAVVPSFVTATYGYNWLNYEWQQTGNNWEREVTRNADGNVTKVERRVLYQGIFDPTQRFMAEYGADGKASRMWSEELTSDGFNLYWEEGDVYTDIVWDRTDGQIFSAEDVMYGANRISSARVTSDGDELTLTVEYPDELGSYKGVISGSIDGAEVTSVIQHTVLDSYGSYEEVITETYSYDGITESMVQTNKYLTDDSGLDMLVYASETYEGEEEIYEWAKAKLIRDSEGRPAEYIQQMYDYDSGEFENSMRIVFSDYIDAAGVGSAIVDDTDAPVQLYDLRGVPVHGDAAPGLYIRRQGDKVSKVMIK